MKNSKRLKQAHTSNAKKGMGDYYGSAIRAKFGRMRGDTIGQVDLKPSQLKKPPKSLA